MSETDPILSIAHDIGDIKERCARTEEGIKRVESKIDNVIDWNKRQDDDIKELNDIKAEFKAGWKIADWIKQSGIVTGAIAFYHYFIKGLH